MKYVLSFLFASLVFKAKAQNSLGFFAGPQATTALYTVQEKKQDTRFQYGFQAGSTLKVPFEGKLYFSPFLYYSQLGYKVTLKEPNVVPGYDVISNQTRIHTITVAPLLQFNFSNNPSHFFLQAGPQFEFVVGGHQKYQKTNKEFVSEPMKFDFANYGFVTASVTGHLGYESSKGLFVFAHYDYGVGNANNADVGLVILHRVAGITIGKYLRKNPNVIDTRNRE